MPRCFSQDEFRHRVTRLALVVVCNAVVVLLLALCGRVSAQPPVHTQQAAAAADTSDRQALRQRLQQHSAVFAAHAAAVKTAAKFIEPSVVHVEAEVSPRFALQLGHAPQMEDTGSGVIVEVAGRLCVFTNRHVISGADPKDISIRLADGRIIHPTQVWSDADTDVAVMAVQADHLTPASLGDSDRMEIGDFVLAVGSPFGLSYSVTYGIISAKGRRGLNLGHSGLRLQDFLQTDAAINPGNSGGPLVNLQGEVIGINTAIASNSGGSEGIGFAIPSNLFVRVAEELIRHGRVRWAFLGVTLAPEFDADTAKQLGLNRPAGALVTAVTPNSAAAAAGLQPNDVILQVGNVVIEDDKHLVNVVNLSPVGSTVPLVIWRDGRKMTIRVELQERPQS